MAKNERFEVILSEGNSMNEAGSQKILLDKETGVQYLLWKSGYGAGITPLLDSAGKPVVTENFSGLSVKE